MVKKNGHGGKRPNQTGRPLVENKKDTKRVKVSPVGLIKGMSAKNIRAAAEWGVLNGYNGIKFDDAPSLNRGDKITLRIETGDSFEHVAARVTTVPIMDITGTWVVGVMFYGQKKSVFPVSAIVKK